jgi:hypothetical protein
MVTVTAAVPQSPSAPVIGSAVAKSPTAVDLTWSAGAGSAGVAAYQITRNGSVPASVPEGCSSTRTRRRAPARHIHTT